MPKSKKDKNTVLIICEKPAAAQKIAVALGNPEKKNLGGVAYYELERDGKRILIGCAVGHLFSLKQMSGKGWPVFDIAWEPNFKVKKKDWSKKYYNALSKLCKEARPTVVPARKTGSSTAVGAMIPVRPTLISTARRRVSFSSAGNL